MSLKKELWFDFIITFVLWQIYTRNTGNDLPSFGLNSFLFGAPYFLSMIRNLFMNGNPDITIPEIAFLAYSGTLLVCAFSIMTGNSTVVYIGVGNLGDFAVSHTFFSSLFLPLGAFPLFKIF
ncbi:hypothetical protein [Cetobacterium sp.]|uniref:hypothetical protein n=1 Tax=Cetobacterium sp. TaxID=2071632 RepID=UPI003EE6CEB4